MKTTFEGWSDARYDEGVAGTFRRYWRHDTGGHLVVVRTIKDSIGRKARCTLYGPMKDGRGMREQLHADTLKQLLLMWTAERLEGRW